MRFLADESVDVAVVRALRADGHDVVAIAEVSPGISDNEVARVAVREDRILVTEDRDFGRLFVASTSAGQGVIYLRYPASARSAVGRDVAALVAQEGGRLAGAFVVMQPGRIRLSRMERRRD